MLDAAVIQGGAAAVGGLAVGLGMAWFSEQQVEQGEQRGSDAVSEATRAKMSAMLYFWSVMGRGEASCDRHDARRHREQVAWRRP